MTMLHPRSFGRPALAAVRAALASRRRGQVMILFALMLPMLMAMVALGIDAAHLYGQRRTMQGAADLAALAGVTHLPDSPSAAKAEAKTIATANGYTVGVNATAPYGGSNGKIEVTIDQDVETFFLPVLGIDSVDVGVRAVAIKEVGDGFALFAIRNDCTDSNNEETIDWSGNLAEVIGRVHSNSGIKHGGNDNKIDGPGTYVCDLDPNNPSSKGNTYNPGPNPTKSGKLDLPVKFTASDFPCTTTIPDGKIEELGAAYRTGTTLKPGIYCFPGKITLGTTGYSGDGVTFVATGNSGFIEFSGGGYNFNTGTAGHKNVLAYAEGTGNSVIKLNGNDGQWVGYLYAEKGQVEFSGNGNTTLKGSVIADRIKLNGNEWGVDSTGFGETRQGLIE
jgi:hypothetical protein